jgi:hypothetical protein
VSDKAFRETVDGSWGAERARDLTRAARDSVVSTEPDAVEAIFRLAAAIDSLADAIEDR